MTKNVKVRATLKGTLSLMGNSGIKEEGQIKIHQDIVLANISYEQWMERYDKAMTMLKTGTSPREKELENYLKDADGRHIELIQRYDKAVAQLKAQEASQPPPKQTPKEVIIVEIKGVKPTPKKKVVSKKKV